MQRIVDMCGTVACRLHHEAFPSCAVRLLPLLLQSVPAPYRSLRLENYHLLSRIHTLLISLAILISRDQAGSGPTVKCRPRIMPKGPTKTLISWPLLPSTTSTMEAKLLQKPDLLETAIGQVICLVALTIAGRRYVAVRWTGGYYELKTTDSASYGLRHPVSDQKT